MKVIKRDGRAVDYDRSKIQIAIEKANQEVSSSNRASTEDIKSIIQYIEELDKKRILVEDIQDIIEERLMQIKKYELAKKYIVYRYTRALVRKQNTTDETILGIIRNENSEEKQNTAMTAAEQRNYIASEVSRDLTKRLLLPEKIAKANEEGMIYFHNEDYFVHPMINSSYINMESILDNGTIVNGKMIEQPKSFLVACIIATQVIATISSNQCFGQSINMSCFGKYLRKSYDKYKEQIEREYKGKLTEEFIENLVRLRVQSELQSGIQLFQYQINTLEAINGKEPVVTLFLHIDEQDKYLKENAMIIEEILKQRYEGLKDENENIVTPEYPKLVYVLDECNALNGGEYDYITKLAIKCSAKRKYPIYLSAKRMRENYKGNVFCPIGNNIFLTPWKNEEGKYQFEGRFNQGIVSINLPQIAILADGDEQKFWNILDERLELCYEALMCRHYSLVGIESDISPMHWQHGAISKLEKRERIDSLLYGGYSILTLGYIGIAEMVKLIKGKALSTEEGHQFALKVIKHLKETSLKWEKETNIEFVICGMISERLGKRFAQKDKEKFGTIKDINDKGKYTSAYCLNKKENIGLYEKLQLESDFEKISLGGVISYINIKKLNETELENIIKYIYENIQLSEFEN